MTSADAIAFVKDEIATRFKNLNDTQFSDWARACQYVDRETATAVVRELMQDPELTLNLRTFKRLCWQRRRKTQQRTPEPVSYSACVVCLEAPVAHPGWQGRSWLQLEGCVTSRRTDATYMQGYAAERAGRVQAQEGGKWCGEVRERCDEGYTGPLTHAEVCREAEQSIIDGPDCQARRWVLDRKRRRDATGRVPDAITARTIVAELAGAVKSVAPLPMPAHPEKIDPGPTRGPRDAPPQLFTGKAGPRRFDLTLEDTGPSQKEPGERG